MSGTFTPGDLSRRRRFWLLVTAFVWLAIDLSFVFLVPIFGAMFADFETRPPALTVAFIDLAAFSRHSMFHDIVFWGGLIAATMRAVRKERRRFAIGFVAVTFLVLVLLVVAMLLPVVRLGLG